MLVLDDLVTANYHGDVHIEYFSELFSLINFFYKKKSTW